MCGRRSLYYDVDYAPRNVRPDYYMPNAAGHRNFYNDSSEVPRLYGEKLGHSPHLSPYHRVLNAFGSVGQTFGRWPRLRKSVKYTSSVKVEDVHSGTSTKYITEVKKVVYPDGAAHEFY